jgi:putative ABC transport system permease protein
MTSPTPRLIFRLAWRNVRRNWRHSLAALGTMTVGFVALALFQGYLDEMLRSQMELVYARNMIGEIQVRRPRAGSHDARMEPAKYRLDEREQAFVEGWIKEHQADVKVRVRGLIVRGMISAGGGAAAEFFAVGADVPEGRISRRNWAWNTWAGRPIKDDEPNALVLAMGLAAILGCEPTGNEPVMDPKTGTPFPVERPFRCKQAQMMLTASSAHGRVNALEGEVVGLTTGSNREFDQRMLFAPLGMLQELADTRGLSNFQIVLNNPSDAPRLRQDLRDAAARGGMALDVQDWKDTEAADVFRRGMNLLSVLRSLVVLVFLVIAGAAVLTTMMKTVRERTREVGTLRSLGYRSNHMLAMFAIESALLAIMAGVAGLVCAVGLTAAINTTQITYKAGLLAESIALRIGYSPGAYAWGFAFLSFVAVTAALAAARKVARMPIATALADG